MTASNGNESQAVTTINPPDATLSDKIIPLSEAITPELTRMGHVVKSTAPATQAKAKAAATLPTHHFKYQGRRWRLFKRSRSPEATWQIVFEQDGKRYSASLRTTAQAAAEAEAKSYIDKFLSRARADRSGLTTRAQSVAYTPLATIIGHADRWPDDLGIVPALPITAGIVTRRSYVWSLRWVLRLALDLTDPKVDGLTAEVLNKATARQFWAKVMLAAGQIEAQQERNRYLRNARTFYDNAKTLFAPLPLDAMRETHRLVLPDLTDWRNGRKLFLREKITKAQKFNRPDDDLIRKTFVEWPRLARTPGYVVPTCDRRGPALADRDRRNVFIAVGLALACGLRMGEIEKARWDWWQVSNGRPLLADGEVNVKNHSGALAVRPLDPFWTILNRTIARHGWRAAPGEYCLTGDCASDREFWCQHVLSKWLRHLGWRTQKAAHALRDLSASYVTMKFGLDRARIFCRHGQIATTQDHYSGFVDEDAMDDPRRLAWLRWAK